MTCTSVACLSSMYPAVQIFGSKVPMYLFLSSHALLLLSNSGERYLNAILFRSG